MKTLLIFMFCVFSFTISQSQIVFGDYTSLDNKYGNIGSLHNKVLENCYLNMPFKDGFSYDQAVSYISEYNMNYLSKVAKPSNYFDLKQVEPEFTIRKYYVNKKTFTEQLLDKSNPNSIDGINRDLKKYPILSAKNQLIFYNISENIKANLNGSMSNENFEKSLVDIYNNFAKGSDELGNEIIGEIITIGLLSSEWWRNNPKAADEPTTIKGKGGPSITEFENNISPYVVPVVAMDAAGALVSAGAVALNNYINNGSVNWAAVGTGAVIGAVTGSTGLVGKVGKWISSFF